MTTPLPYLQLIQEFSQYILSKDKRKYKNCVAKKYLIISHFFALFVSLLPSNNHECYSQSFLIASIENNSKQPTIGENHEVTIITGSHLWVMTHLKEEEEKLRFST